MNYRYAAFTLLLIALLIVPASATIVGVTWNQSNSSPSAFSSYWGANYAPIAAPDFNATEPWASMGRVNNSATQSQTMVQVKKHYYRTENFTIGSNHYMNFSISDVPATGYTVDPWHVINGTEVPWAYIGAFEASTYNTSTSTYNTGDFSGVVVASSQLSSIAGAKPTSGKNNTLTLPNFRTLAQNRGTGWELQPVSSVSVIQRMYIIEHRNWDSQTILGTGVTQIADDGLTNMAIPTGLTAGVGANSTNLGNASGSVTTVHYQTGQVTNQISYRGVEALYGNMYKWVDGLNIRANNTPWIADHSFASDTFASPYTNTGLTISASNGYFSNIAYGAAFDWAFLPSGVTGSSSTYLSDYYYQASGNTSARYGGYWYLGADAGAFCWNLNSAASLVFRSVGSRLAFTPPVVANFSFSNITSAMSFTDTSYNISTRTGLVTNVTSWNWSFGDGALSTLQNPTHAYAPGTYTVNLTVSDGTNYATSLQQVTQLPVVADFHADTTTPMTYQVVTFTDDSTGSPTSWYWDFNDGNTSTLQNPTHAYAWGGSFSVNLSANTTTSQSWMNKSNYITVHDLSGFNYQDLTMTPQYALTLTIVDSATLLPIPVVTVTDSLGYNQTTSTGVFTHSYDYGTVLFYLISSGYDTRSYSVVMDSNRTETVTMTATEAAPGQNANVVWQPRSVAIQILDANYNPILYDPVYISAHSSSLPGGLSGAVAYFKATYGVTDTTANSMFAANTTYYGTTDDNGFIAVQVVDIIQYQVITHDTTGFNTTRLFWPSGPYYQIVTGNATVAGLAAQGRTQAAINMNSTFNTSFWEPNATYSCMGINVYDSTGQTNDVYAWWKLVDNGTVWWTNSTAIGGYGPINSTKCVLHVPYQQWKWGGITG